MILPDDENFLLLFRRETPLDNSVEFMRIWRSYDADSSGFISAGELKDFLRDLFLQHNKVVAEVKLEEYTDTMVRKESNNVVWIIVLPENPPEGKCPSMWCHRCPLKGCFFPRRSLWEVKQHMLLLLLCTVLDISRELHFNYFCFGLNGLL
uniref:EF-hand domain-containing protein n=1 Tax=Anas platyrhynchos platyrhynchos TaxID=8840 RepID=A0A493T7Z1_ANAPP